MKVILLAEVRTLGKKGEIKTVSDGYAQNFLFPKKLAKPATEEAIRTVEHDQKIQAEQNEKLKNDARMLVEKINGKEFVLQVKASKGKLFGSISSKDVVQALKTSGFDVSEQAIHLPQSIKTTGLHLVIVRMHPEVEARIHLKVEAE